ncbi:MAG: BTAD domain-containing putative transcriptional regulator [Anaerolineae bacterium]|jgi:WD40 repeat protein/DNA-binding SARP family transcriptional activator
MKGAFHLRLLGPVHIEHDGKPVRGFRSRKALALLAYLAVEGQPVPRQRLVDLFWGDKAESQGRNNLSWVLHRLSTRLPGCLQADRHTVEFPRGPSGGSCWLDLDTFEELATQGDAASLERAAELYRGEFLEGLYLKGCPEFELWQVRERERWRRRVTGVLNELVGHHSRQGKIEQGLHFARRLLRLEPWREEAHRAAMRLLAQGGQRSAALAQHETCRRILAEELGVEPSEATERLYQQIQAGDLASVAAVRGLDLLSQPPAPGDPPFKGLAFFDVADADLFFGRDILTARLVQLLGEPPTPSPEEGVGGGGFLAVVGTSGCGKSSVVRAGLVAALQRGKPLADGTPPPEGSHLWPVVIITPTANPLESLALGLTRSVDPMPAATALVDNMARDFRSLHRHIRRTLSPSAQARTGRRLLLVVDQFEELFTQCHDPAQREAFVDNLLTAAAAPSPSQGEGWGEGEGHGGDDGSTLVVITLRADFYHHCAQFESLRAALEQHQAYIGPMTLDELRSAIEEPARRSGWNLEPGLVDLLLRDVGDEPGALPLLSHALLETWKRRRGHTLTLGGYAETGGVQGAIAMTAEAVYQRLDESQQAIARNIFLRLTELGESTQDTRRRARLAELLPRPEEATTVETVINTLADARLITTERETVQVAHEALIREWPSLREWLEEDRAFRVWQGRLWAALRQWEASDGDEGALLRGAPLMEAEQWLAQRSGDLNPNERSYIRESVNVREREQTAQERRRRRLTLAAVGAAAIFLALAVFGRIGWRQAEELRQEAEVRRQVALSRQLAAQSVNQLGVGSHATALLLAIEAGRAAETAEATSLLHELFTRLGYPILTLSGHTDGVQWVEWNEDGSRILTASSDGTVRVWDARTGAELIVLSRHAGGVTQAMWNRDEQLVLTAGEDRAARVWDAETGSELVALTGHRDAVRQAVWDSDESRILTASSDGTARVWDASTGAEVLTLSGHDGAINQAAWSDDEHRILTAGDDGTVRVWDVSTLRQPQDGTALDTDGGIATELLILSGHSRAVNRAVWNGDSSRILTASDDGTARVWDADTGTPLVTCFGHAAPVNQVVWNSDESLILTASDDGTARVWDAETGTKLVTLSGHAEAVSQAFWSRDESRILTASDDGTARTWDTSAALNTGTETGAELLILSGHGDRITQVRWNADESRILTGSADSTARVWDAERGGELATLSGHRGAVNQAVWNGDASRILTAGRDRTARVWDSVTGTELLTLSGHVDEVRQVLWSSDEDCILTAGQDNTARVWDVSTLRQTQDGTAPSTGAEAGVKLVTLSHQRATVISDPWGLRAMWNSNGSRILTAGDDGTVRVWVVSTPLDTGAETGDELLTLSVSGYTVLQAVWNADETRILTASRDGTARVWDVSAALDTGTETGAELISLSGHTGPVNQATWDSDEGRILTAGADGTARTWDAESGLELLTLLGHTHELWSAQWNGDGSRILTASSDGTARVWNAEDGLELLTLSGHTNEIHQAVWNGEESRILTASSDGTARVWDAATGAELFTLSGHTDAVNQAVWSRDDRLILTASSDGTVRQWYAWMEDLLEAACQRAPRNMSQEEWQEFMKDEPYRPTCPGLLAPAA